MMETRNRACWNVGTLMPHYATLCCTKYKPLEIQHISPM